MQLGDQAAQRTRLTGTSDEGLCLTADYLLATTHRK